MLYIDARNLVITAANRGIYKWGNKEKTKLLLNVFGIWQEETLENVVWSVCSCKPVEEKLIEALAITGYHYEAKNSKTIGGNRNNKATNRQVVFM